MSNKKIQEIDFIFIYKTKHELEHETMYQFL